MNRVLMIGLTPPLDGGSERHIYELSSRIDNCDVLTQKGSICKNKIEIPIIGYGAMRNISFLLNSLIFSLFLIFVPAKKYKIIHIHENLLYFLIPLLRLRYKVITTVHGIKGFKFFDNQFLWFFFRQALKFSNRLIAVNIEDKKELLKYFNEVNYIPNGVNNAIYKKINPRVQNKISFIGRIHQQKGIVYLLEAFNLVKDKIPGIKIEILAKNNDYASELKKIFTDKNIIWRGFISDRKNVVRSLKSSFCIALPSLWEGLPLTLLESLASGRPVITTSIPAIKSVVNEKEVLFVRPRDSKDLSEKILLVFSNPSLSKKIGKNGLNKSKNYEWNEISQSLVKEYSSL